MYWSYYGENNTGEEIDLTSLVPRTLADATGVVVEVLEDGIDFDSKGRKLKYSLPDMRKYDIKENMLFGLLHLICGDPGAVDYFDLSEVEQERYDRFMEVYYTTCEADQFWYPHKPTDVCIVVYFLLYGCTTPSAGTSALPASCPGTSGTSTAWSFSGNAR